jgi:hypothetical protein
MIACSFPKDTRKRKAAAVPLEDPSISTREQIRNVFEESLFTSYLKIGSFHAMINR